MRRLSDRTDTCSDATTSGVSAAEQLQRQVPGATVMTAINTVFASRHAAPLPDGQPLDGLLDPAAPMVVLLEGRGGSEPERVALADLLPPAPASVDLLTAHRPPARGAVSHRRRSVCS